MKHLTTLLTMAITFTGLGQQFPDYLPTDGLVIWLPLNGEVQSWSAQGVEWSVFGTSPATDRFGIEDQALGFNGSDDWAQSSESLIPSFGDFTISIWLHGMNNNAHSEAISQGGSAINSTYIGNTPEGNIRVGGGADWGWDGIESYPFDLWAHFVIVKTSSLSTLYVNGEVVSTSTAYTNPVNSGTTLLGEQNNLYGNEFWLGSIDDVGIWNRALTEQEVFALYNAVSPITGCTDELACNFNPDAVVDNGTCASCEQLQTACLEGTVWSEQLGGCIVANVSDTDFDGCVGINDFLVHLSNFGSGCGPESAWSCGDPLEYQGYDYETVQIGEQCWFAENCRYLPNVNAPSDRSNTEAKYYVWQNTSTDVVVASTSEEYMERGALYNHPAAMTTCPQGWKLPSSEDFEGLSIISGGDEFAGTSLNSTNMGGDDIWEFQINRTGYLNDEGSWLAPNRANFWNASPDPLDSENALYRYTIENEPQFLEAGNRLRAGKAVRCLKE